MISSAQAAAQPLPTSICGHQFRDLTLLEVALTHPSSTDNSQADLRLRYQRLEFLGDAVWSFYVSDTLIALCSSAPESELTLRRARLISAPALAQMAKVLGLPALLVLGRGEDGAGGRQKVSILSSALEAVIGAIYLDGGAEVIRQLARDACCKQLGQEEAVVDPKTALQEFTQSRFRATPRYRMLRRRGPTHAPIFEMEVRIGRSAVGRGIGPNKQDAERAAAIAALAALSAGSHTTSSSHP